MKRAPAPGLVWSDLLADWIDPAGLAFLTMTAPGRWQRRKMPEWYFQALFPDLYAQRREEVSVRVYQKLEPWGA